MNITLTEYENLEYLGHAYECKVDGQSMFSSKIQVEDNGWSNFEEVIHLLESIRHNLNATLEVVRL